MKLRNKKTGEICEFMIHKRIKDSKVGNPVYAPFTDSVENWEDYEEPKECWYVDTYGKVWKKDSLTLKDGFDFEPLIKFETREEAEKAVEKLKAWKRLKDKGIFFEIKYSRYTDEPFTITGELGCTIGDETKADLDLLFGGEE